MRTVATLTGRVTNLRWSPDGASLAYLAPGDGADEVWHWKARHEPSSAWGTARWDAEDGFVSIAGPVGGRRGDAGFRAVPCFSVAHPDIRGLRIRVAAQLAP